MMAAAVIAAAVIAVAAAVTFCQASVNNFNSNTYRHTLI
jgi:hypothetical protein